MYNYYPKRPIKSFQDLEVYQKLLAVSVAIAKRIGGQRDNSQKGGNNAIGSVLFNLALDLPVKIAAAHSLRFSDCQKAISILEEIMLGCNLLIVYLAQYRDIENSDIETEFFDEQTKILLSTRMKVMHLQMSWKKFSKEKETNEK